MRFRPCIDLHEGRVKQIIGSSLRDSPCGNNTAQACFVSDYSPGYYAKLYQRDELEGGHVIMLGPGNEQAAREALAAYPGGLHVGGGITIENAQSWLEAGAAKVIVTSYVITKEGVDWTRLARLCRSVGQSNLVLDVSCTRVENDYYIAADRWQRVTDTPVNARTLQSMAAYCTEFLVHAVDVEGKQEGIDEALVRHLATSSPIPTTYAGGVRNMEDVYRLEKTGRGNLDVTVGSALDIFGGPLPYAELVAFDKQRRSG